MLDNTCWFWNAPKSPELKWANTYLLNRVINKSKTKAFFIDTLVIWLLSFDYKVLSSLAWISQLSILYYADVFICSRNNNKCLIICKDEQLYRVLRGSGGRPIRGARSPPYRSADPPAQQSALGLNTFYVCIFK